MHFQIIHNLDILQLLKRDLLIYLWKCFYINVHLFMQFVDVFSIISRRLEVFPSLNPQYEICYLHYITC